VCGTTLFHSSYRYDGIRRRTSIFASNFIIEAPYVMSKQRTNRDISVLWTQSYRLQHGVQVYGTTFFHSSYRYDGIRRRISIFASKFVFEPPYITSRRRTVPDNIVLSTRFHAKQHGVQVCGTTLSHSSYRYDGIRRRTSIFASNFIIEAPYVMSKQRTNRDISVL
jgi:hypothetical protein